MRSGASMHHQIAGFLWAKSRNWTPEDLKNRESNQLPLFSKKQRSNFVIMNDGDINKLRAIVKDRLDTLMPKKNL